MDRIFVKAEQRPDRAAAGHRLRLTDLPAEWSRQLRRMLGLPAR